MLFQPPDKINPNFAYCGTAITVTKEFFEFRSVCFADCANPQTCRGRIMYVLGYFFSGYCAYKMFMATINFIFSRDPNRDPVTTALMLAVRWAFERRCIETGRVVYSTNAARSIANVESSITNQSQSLRCSLCKWQGQRFCHVLQLSWC